MWSISETKYVPLHFFIAAAKRVCGIGCVRNAGVQPVCSLLCHCPARLARAFANLINFSLPDRHLQKLYLQKETDEVVEIFKRVLFECLHTTSKQLDDMFHSIKHAADV